MGSPGGSACGTMGYPFVYALENGEPSEEVLDKEAAEDLVEEGALTDSTQCWNEDMEGWTDWSECKVMFGFEASSPRAQEEEYDYEYYTVLQYQYGDEEVSEEIDTADVHGLIEQGMFGDETMVWTEGMDDWYPWGQCKVQFGFDADDAEADGAEAEQVEEWLQGLTDSELKEQCEIAEIELESTDPDSMRAALRAMYAHAAGGEGDTEAVTALIYEKADGSYSDETPLAEAWELAEAGTIKADTLCWAEGLDDWAPWREAKHWFFDLEEDAPTEEPAVEGAPSEGVPPGPSIEETAETAAMRAKYAAMRPYQVKNECKKRRLPHDGAAPELIEALIVYEFGGGAAAAKEMAAAAKAKADEEAQRKKEEHHKALIEAERKATEEETAYLKKAREQAATKKQSGAAAKPEAALQDLGYSSKQVRQALKQTDGDQDKALEILQKSKKHLSAMTDEELNARVDEVMADIDSYDTGQVGFRQLLSWVRRQQGGARVTDEMLTHGLELFHMYDVDGSGALDKSEIREMMLEMEQDHLFSKVIASFLDVPDEEETVEAKRVLTLEEIAIINKNEQFIEGVEELMMDYIEAELRGLNIPSIKGKQGWGVYELLDIKTKKFDVKADKMTVDSAGRYRVMKNCKVRENKDKDSAEVGTMKPGTMVKVLESTQVDGQTRIRCRSGWLSVIAVDGSVLLQKEECIVVHVADIHCLLKNFKCKLASKP